MKKMKYIIVSPKSQTGGTTVLHALCQYLSELGINAKISDVNKVYYWLSWMFFSLKASVKSLLLKIVGEKHFAISIDMKMKCKRKYFPFLGKNTIVVYPEIIFGNPLRAKNVVRWLLFYNKIYKEEDGKTLGYDKDDVFFCYRKVFNDERLNPYERKLHIEYYDLDLYKRTNYGDRKGNCYIVRKGAGRSDIPKNFDGPVIDNLTEAEKVEVFNRCEYCISYDTQTAYSQIAAMCGCISVIVPEEGKNKYDYLKSDDTGFGVAFGFSKEEISYAIDTRDKVIDLYKRVNNSAMNSVEGFIEECTNCFFKIV
jgi:hypothetical protein